MAKIPIILEPGRADGKLAITNALFDENKNMFQSEINDVQDTLNSDNPNKPLSANQGKVLKELLDTKVIETGAIPIDTEPTEGNTTHVVTSDGIHKALNEKVNNTTFEERNKNQDQKLSELDYKINGNKQSANFDYTVYPEGNEYIVKKSEIIINSGKTYNISINSDDSSNITFLRLFDETNSSIVVSEIPNTRGNTNRTFTYTADNSGKLALVVLLLNTKVVYTIDAINNDNINSHLNELSKEVQNNKITLESFEESIKDADNALFGEQISFIETYNFTNGIIGQSYYTKKGTNAVYAGHVYQIEITSGSEDNTSELKQYDLTNTSLILAQIEGSKGIGNRTITYYCELDGIIACSIIELKAKVIESVKITDITNIGTVKKVEFLSEMFSIANKNILVVADSISTGSSSAKLDSINMPSYGGYEKWVDILISYGFFGRKTINCSQHATGFVAKNGESDWINNSDFLSRVKYFVNNGTIKPDTIDIIIVFGGINDFKLPCEIGEFGEKDTTKFIPALEAFYNYLEETFTQARIVVCTPTRCAVTTGQTDWSTRVDWAPNEGFVADENSLRITYDAYVDAIKKCCKKYSLPIIDLAYESGFMPLNKKNREKWSFVFDESASIPTDGIHPNYDFQKNILAPFIFGYLNKMFGLTL